MDIVSKVSELSSGAVNISGYNIDSITYEKEDGLYYLRVIITKNGTITVEDCVAADAIFEKLMGEVLGKECKHQICALGIRNELSS